MNLRTGRLGWARYTVLASLLLLLLALALGKSYLAVLLLLPFAYGVAVQNWRSHIWLCFVLLFYFLVGINRLAHQVSALGIAVVILTVVLFIAAMLYCRWSKAAS